MLLLDGRQLRLNFAIGFLDLLLNLFDGLLIFLSRFLILLHFARHFLFLFLNLASCFLFLLHFTCHFHLLLLNFVSGFLVPLLNLSGLLFLLLFLHHNDKFIEFGVLGCSLLNVVVNFLREFSGLVFEIRLMFFLEESNFFFIRLVNFVNGY